MDFDAFKRLALTTLLGHQLDNGTWFNDPVSTIVAVEVFCEELGGPDPVCRSSELYRELHPDLDVSWGIWPWGSTGRRELGAYPYDAASAYSAAISHAIWFRHGAVLPEGPMDQGRAWVAAKWLRMISLADTDFQLQFSDVIEGFKRFKTKESWLIAQIALAELHSLLHFGVSLGFMANRVLLRDPT